MQQILLKQFNNSFLIIKIITMTQQQFIDTTNQSSSHNPKNTQRLLTIHVHHPIQEFERKHNEK